MENRIDSENKILEIRAEEVQLPKPDFLRRYKEEDIRQYLQDASCSLSPTEDQGHSERQQ